MAFMRLALACMLLLMATACAHTPKGVLVLVDAHVKPTKRDAAIAGFRRSQARCADWPGCRRFEIGISDSDPNHVMLVEHWDSVALHKAEHARITAQESFRAFRALLERDLVFRYLTLR
ncbi:MAG: antibiotic biosynthesis monooxygenase [Myxococcales bacterium]|nr:antibiotic biosynthesis monooxygenase [Myxococcales bacterium]